MSEQTKSSTVAALIQASLTQPAAEKSATETPAPAAEPTPTDAATARTDPLDDVVAELIELYFQLEAPAERDVLLEELVQHPSALVTDFLRQMMQQDADEFMRVSAAQHLAAHQDAAALAFLQQQLDAPDNPALFSRAVEILSQLRGPAFYEQLVNIWLDGQRPREERSEAMRALEVCDPARALNDYCLLLDAMERLEDLLHDQLDIAITAFVRHEHRPGQQALSALRERLLVHGAQGDAATAEDAADYANIIANGLSLMPPPDGVSAEPEQA